MPTKKSKILPEYDNPPLTEVVCGITFQPLNNFIATHFGIFWSSLQPNFPKAEEVAPLASPIELIEGQPFQMEFSDIPPLPRQMFISQDGRNVIQVQRDRFILNWRKLDLDDTYPRYENVFSEFQNKLNIFESFINKGGMQIVPAQYELTYLNHIAENDLWKKNSELVNIFPNYQSKINNGLILKEPENINSRISFLLPDKMGRLHVTIKTGAKRKADNKEIVIFELTARGFNNNENLAEMVNWFNMAREWIVKGFTDLTSKEIQKDIWKRSQ